MGWLFVFTRATIYTFWNSQIAGIWPLLLWGLGSGLFETFWNRCRL